VSHGEPIELATAPNGDFYVADPTDTVTKVDHVTGAHTVIRHGFSQAPTILDMKVAADGNLIVLIYDPATLEVSLLRFSTSNGAPRELSDDGIFDFPHSLTIEFDGKVVVADGHRLIQVDPATGEQRVLTTLDHFVNSVTVRADGQLFVRTEADNTALAQLVQVDPRTGATTNIARGGLLNPSDGHGMAWHSRMRPTS
jgi:hypothetical protein